MLTGARIPAPEAAKIGLISRVVPKDQLLDEAKLVSLLIDSSRLPSSHHRRLFGLACSARGACAGGRQ